MPVQALGRRGGSGSSYSSSSASPGTNRTSGGAASSPRAPPGSPNASPRQPSIAPLHGCAFSARSRRAASPQRWRPRAQTPQSQPAVYGCFRLAVDRRLFAASVFTAASCDWIKTSRSFGILGPPERFDHIQDVLTQCACCATDLGLTLGKKCGRCSTHATAGLNARCSTGKKGGHDQLCKKIKKAGGAEQYNANKKYAEAVAVAVEKCADDTKGQTCFICTQALHWKTKEGLVRGCACRGRRVLSTCRAW